MTLPFPPPISDEVVRRGVSRTALRLLPLQCLLAPSTFPLQASAGSESVSPGSQHLTCTTLASVTGQAVACRLSRFLPPSHTFSRHLRLPVQASRLSAANSTAPSWLRRGSHLTHTATSWLRRGSHLTHTAPSWLRRGSHLTHTTPWALILGVDVYIQFLRPSPPHGTVSHPAYVMNTGK